MREEWSLSQGNPFIRLRIVNELLNRQGSTGPYPVNEIYGGGQDDEGNVVENHYNDDLIPEMISLVKTVDELVSNGVLASLDIYSY
jgi:hypothetical protein